MFNTASDFLKVGRTESMGGSETGIFSRGNGRVVHRSEDDTDDGFFVVSLDTVKQILYRHRRRKDSVKPYYRGRIGSQIPRNGCGRPESPSSVVAVYAQRLPSSGAFTILQLSLARKTMNLSVCHGNILHAKFEWIVLNVLLHMCAER